MHPEKTVCTSQRAPLVTIQTTVHRRAEAGAVRWWCLMGTDLRWNGIERRKRRTPSLSASSRSKSVSIPSPVKCQEKSDGGKVCTWEMISGVTEEGRHFEDYTGGDRVRTQRPYYKAGAAADNLRDDPRPDPTYSRACVGPPDSLRCAHLLSSARFRRCVRPTGLSISQGNFVNGFYPRGLGHGRRLDRHRRFGAYTPGENNGILAARHAEQSESLIFPTTDDARMRRFENELAYGDRSRATCK